MKRFLLLTIFGIGMGLTGWGQTTLAAGDIAIIGFNTNTSPDNLAILVLKDLTAGTVFYVNDNEVLTEGGTTFNDMNEAEASFTVKTGQTITAGTVIVLPWGAAAVSATTYDWSSTSGAGLGNGEEIYVYTATDITATTPTAFIYGVTQGSNTGLRPSGLTDNYTWVDFGTTRGYKYKTEGAVYTGTQAQLLTAIGTTSNYDSGSTVTLNAGDWTFTVNAGGLLDPPTLTADATNNNVDNNIDITFTDNATWRSAITAVKIGGTALTVTTDYVITSGNIQLKPSGGNSLLTTSGSKILTMEATGYNVASVTQDINAGAPTANSTATISSALGLGTTRTVTCTAKDQYNNLVSGYTFKFDLATLDDDATTDESYTVDGVAYTVDANNVNLTTNTIASGVATFDITIPGTVDADDGVIVQVQLADGTTDIGSSFDYTRTPPQITLTGTDPGSAGFQQGSLSNVLYRIEVTVANDVTNLTALDWITDGTYLAADIATNGFKLWYSTDNSFGGDTELDNEASTSTGTGEVLSFSGFNQQFAVGTAYLFITADITASATVGNTISGEATANGDFTFSGGATFTGSSFGSGNLHTIAAGPSVLEAGDIAFIAIASDAPDRFAFINFVALNGNTTITFTDNAWDGSTLFTNENTGTYTAPAEGLPAGSVITVTDPGSGSTSTVTGGGSFSGRLSGLAADGDQIHAYQGSDFISSISTTSWLTIGSVNNNTSYLPSELTNQVNAMDFLSHLDNGFYAGPTSGTVNFLRSAINNPNNWATSDDNQTWLSWSFTLGNSTSLASAATVMNLEVAGSESMTVETSGQLTITGTLTNNAGAARLLIESDATGTGSLITSSTSEATVERYLTNYSTVDDAMYHFISSPVASQAIQPNFVANPPLATVDFYKFDEPTNYWINSKAEGGGWNDDFEDNFELGRGYLASYPTEPITKSFTGNLNSYPAGTPLVLTCTYNESGAKGWNLLGNPFPSAIDWTLVLLGEGMDNALYYYDAGEENYRYYLHLDGETGAVGDGSRYIPAMQGFMVHAKSTGTKTVTIDNDDRVHNGQNVYYKSTNTVPGSLSLLVTAGEFSDETFVHFNSNATTLFDGKYDAYKLSSYNTHVPKLYTQSSDGDKLAINGLPELEETIEIPVYFKAGVSGIQTITADVSNIQATVFLVDNKTGNSQNLTLNPVYNFTAEEGDALQRFTLKFGSVGIEEPGIDDFVNIYSFANILYFNTTLSLDATISIFNITGQEVYSTFARLDGMKQIGLNVPTGWYVVKVMCDEGIKSEKIFIR